MLILLSPAKTLSTTAPAVESTQPRLLAHTEKLVGRLRKHSPRQLGTLLSISDKLATLNHGRYQDFATPFSSDNATAALNTFRGDVYVDLRAEDFDDRELAFANRQLRILSGLYGLLRPSDLMQPYRLEMGTKLKVGRSKDLYTFWGDTLTDLLNEDLADEGSGLVVNLASQEYFRSVRTEKLNARLLTLHFRELRGDRYKVVSFNAKKARGAMARAITLEGIRTADPLTSLSPNGYVYNEALSTVDDWVYTLD